MFQTAWAGSGGNGETAPCRPSRLRVRDQGVSTPRVARFSRSVHEAFTKHSRSRATAEPAGIPGRSPEKMGGKTRIRLPWDGPESRSLPGASPERSRSPGIGGSSGMQVFRNPAGQARPPSPPGGLLPAGLRNGDPSSPKKSTRTFYLAFHEPSCFPAVPGQGRDFQNRDRQ